MDKSNDEIYGERVSKSFLLVKIYENTISLYQDSAH